MPPHREVVERRIEVVRARLSNNENRMLGALIPSLRRLIRIQIAEDTQLLHNLREQLTKEEGFQESAA